MLRQEKNKNEQRRLSALILRSNSSSNCFALPLLCFAAQQTHAAMCCALYIRQITRQIPHPFSFFLFCSCLHLSLLLLLSLFVILFLFFFFFFYFVTVHYFNKHCFFFFTYNFAGTRQWETVVIQNRIPRSEWWTPRRAANAINPLTFSTTAKLNAKDGFSCCFTF